MAHTHIKLPYSGEHISGTPDVCLAALRIDRQQHHELQRWIAELRAAGVSAAHPDDGWVDRINNRVHFVYPQFVDIAPCEGDRIALGWPYRHRIVRVIGIKDIPQRFAAPPLPMRWYEFEELTEPSADSAKAGS